MGRLKSPYDPSLLLCVCRKDLGFEILPILRNRQSLLGLESPFDNFGPPPPQVRHFAKTLYSPSYHQGLTQDAIRPTD
jgi:hypothetical protein